MYACYEKDENIITHANAFTLYDTCLFLPTIYSFKCTQCHARHWWPNPLAFFPHYYTRHQRYFFSSKLDLFFQLNVRMCVDTRDARKMSQIDT